MNSPPPHPWFATVSVAAFAATPYFIRAVRLVVAYNREYRAKYARFLKRKLLMRGWAIACAAIAVRAILFFGEDPVHASRYYIHGLDPYALAAMARSWGTY